LDPFTQGIFLAEIRQRCADALIASDLLDKALQSPLDAPMTWFSLRSILIAAASISMLTGGAKGPKRIERAALRNDLGIDDHSVLHHRAIRDHSEHIDHRVLKRLGGGQPGNYFGYNIGRLASGAGRPTTFLHFDQYARIVSFWEDEVSIPEVLAEIRRILPLADAAFLKPR